MIKNHRNINITIYEAFNNISPFMTAINDHKHSIVIVKIQKK